MKKLIPIIAMAAVMTACTGQKQTTGIPLENLDTTAVAQNDFYQFACGGWMAANPLTPEYSRFGSFDKLALNNLEQVNGLIQEIAATKHEQGSVAQKIGDIYNLSLDTARRNVEGIEPVQATLREIAAIESRDEFSHLLGAAMEYGLFAMYVDADAMNSSMNIMNEYQAGFALGEKEYYLDNDETTLSIRQKYEQHIVAMFRLFGQAEPEKAAKTVLRMETRLAKAAKSNVELRDPIANYNKMSVDELQKLVPQIKWSEFFAALGVELDSVNIGQVAHLQEVGKMLADEPLDDLKTMFTWQVIDGAASYLSDEIYMQKTPPYDRSKCTVLVSLDRDDKKNKQYEDAWRNHPNPVVQKFKLREDRDYAVSWIRDYGAGRIFYTSFGHDKRAFLDPARFGHIVAGLQHCLGDL